MVSEQTNPDVRETVMPSAWCMQQYELAVEQGRTKDAECYQQLYEVWHKREVEC